jgi:hypothetical protein
MSKLLCRYAPRILQASEAALRADVTLDGALLIERDGSLTINYAPFEHIQHGARLVIVGITPGAQQATNALLELRRRLKAGATDADALAAAKVFASFSGPMRTNLVAMLDYIGVHKLLGVASCTSLWEQDAALVHFTSALRYPVFVDGANYSRQRPILSTPPLVRLLEECLIEEASALPEALWVPLGPVATEAVGWLVNRGALSPRHMLSGLPHPSGANAERIAYFLGRKPLEKLSSRTNGHGIDATKAALVAQLASLSGAKVSRL